MRRDPSYNAIVAYSRASLVDAARVVHESFGEQTTWDGRIDSYRHLNGCAALSRVGANWRAKGHFSAMIRPCDKDDCSYWFGDIEDSVKDRRIARAFRTNKAKCDKRVFALLLAAYSLE